MNISTGLSSDEREIIQFAQRFTSAYQQNKQSELTSCWEEIQQSRHRHTFKLTTEEEQRIVLARAEREALFKVRLAWHRSKNAHALLAAYDPILDNSKEVPDAERQLIQSAREFVAMYQQVIEALAVNNNLGDDDLISSRYDQNRVQRFTDFTSSENERIKLGRNRVLLRHALKNNMNREIIRLAQEIEADQHEAFENEEQRAAIKIARQHFIERYQPQQVRAHVHPQDGTISVTWQWPSELLVQYAIKMQLRTPLERG